MAETDTTQQALAEACGVAQSAVWKWLSGAVPRGDNLVDISRFFHISVDELLGLSAPVAEILPQVPKRIGKDLSQPLMDQINQLAEPERSEILSAFGRIVEVIPKGQPRKKPIANSSSSVEDDAARSLLRLAEADEERNPSPKYKRSREADAPTVPILPPSSSALRGPKERPPVPKKAPGERES